MDSNNPETLPQTPPDQTVDEIIKSIKDGYETKLTELKNQLEAERADHAKTVKEILIDGKFNGKELNDDAEPVYIARLREKYKKL